MAKNILMGFIMRYYRNFCRFIFTLLVRMKAEEYHHPLKVNRYSKVNLSTKLGKNVNFNGMSIKGNGPVIIGDNFHSGEGCLILTDNHDYDGGEAIPYGKQSICKSVTIEDNVWLGDRVIILPGSWIGEGAIIQAGSVVSGKIPRCTIAGGHPAKVFATRNILNYEKLKMEGKFH